MFQQLFCTVSRFDDSYDLSASDITYTKTSDKLAATPSPSATAHSLPSAPSSPLFILRKNRKSNKKKGLSIGSPMDFRHNFHLSADAPIVSMHQTWDEARWRQEIETALMQLPGARPPTPSTASTLGSSSASSVSEREDTTSMDVSSASLTRVTSTPPPSYLSAPATYDVNRRVSVVKRKPVPSLLPPPLTQDEASVPQLDKPTEAEVTLSARLEVTTEEESSPIVEKDVTVSQVATLIEIATEQEDSGSSSGSSAPTTPQESEHICNDPEIINKVELALWQFFDAAQQ